MTPLARFLATLVGVLLAGIPLVYLTVPRENAEQEQAPRQQQEQTLRTHLSLRYTGKPLSGTLRYEDEVLAELTPQADSPFECFISLPAHITTADIEVELLWPEGSPENAVTLTLEPQGRASRSETQWTGSNGSVLHSIFSLTW